MGQVFATFLKQCLQKNEMIRAVASASLPRVAASDSISGSAVESTSVQTNRLVGRERELAALCDAFDDVRRGSAIVLCVEGMSGIGKSALARHFVAKVRSEIEDVGVLSGRCYKREAVPYKAMDRVVAELSRFLGVGRMFRNGQDLRQVWAETAP
jgi:Cdc6-like AAA superfamily ATPase